MQLDLNDIVVSVKRALYEDCGVDNSDVTADLLPVNLNVEAEIISREPMLFCGRPWVDAVFAEVDKTIVVTWLVKEGEFLDKARILCRINGRAASILTAERVALNFLQTIAATATTAYQYVCALKSFKTRLLDTRKTIPGLRSAQKYAVVCAGGTNHRMGLYDGFLIKENHIKSCGSIANAVKHARKMRDDLLVEVEVETLDELVEAFKAKPDRILLDNFNIEMLTQAVKLNQFEQCVLEASGGIDLSTITKVAQTGVDYVSVGSITKSIRAIDLSLLIRKVE